MVNHPEPAAIKGPIDGIRSKRVQGCRFGRVAQAAGGGNAVESEEMVPMPAALISIVNVIAKPDQAAGLKSGLFRKFAPRCGNGRLTGVHEPSRQRHADAPWPVAIPGHGDDPSVRQCRHDRNEIAQDDLPEVIDHMAGCDLHRLAVDPEVGQGRESSLAVEGFPHRHARTVQCVTA